MKTINRFVYLFLSLFVWGALVHVHIPAPQILSPPTPTYDPLAEPPLPEHPTDLERGRNLYWHWCMPCHGDRGQGLTDEFRAIWEPEHQNCWERGCHGGQGLEEGFPIPTVVPGIVTETHLARFALVQQLSSYLETTHPPQSPGSLESNEYQAIALFVFTMNGRSTVEKQAPATPIPLVTPSTGKSVSARSDPASIIIVAAVLLVGVSILAGIKNRRSSGNR
jgi:hypothetical protein